MGLVKFNWFQLLESYPISGTITLKQISNKVNKIKSALAVGVIKLLFLSIRKIQTAASNAIQYKFITQLMKRELRFTFFSSNRQSQNRSSPATHMWFQMLSYLAHKHTSSLFFLRPLSRQALAFHALQIHNPNHTKVPQCETSRVEHLCPHRVPDLGQHLHQERRSHRGWLQGRPRKCSIMCSKEKFYN